MPSPVTSETVAALIPDGSDQVCDALRGLANLGPAFRDFLEYLLDTDGNPAATFRNEVATSIVPVGATIIWTGDSLPEGFLLANGQSVSRTTYANLFAVIGTKFGAADANSFSLPNTVEKFVLGAGTLGATGGSNTATLVTANIPPHTHDFGMKDESAGGSGTFMPDWSESGNSTPQHTWTTESSGGSGSPAAAQSFSVQNPYIALRYIIRY